MTMKEWRVDKDLTPNGGATPSDEPSQNASSAGTSESNGASRIREPTLHMIGNAHIDPVWLWQWPEGFQEVRASFRSALDRMKEYDDFLFVSSSAAFYEWVERSDPEMFEEIRQRVAEGRWEIVGGWWIQPDCNIPGGESFVRQALYAQRYFKEKFGVTATIGYNVDSFGHNGMLPQILRKSGLTRYIFMRPSPHEMGLPGRLFWWESDDGSRVLAFQILYGYGTGGKELARHIRRCASELKAPFDTLMCFYGVGNHGGGPTRENIESIRRLAEDPTLPHLLFSTPERFFDQIQEQALQFPVVHNDLQHHASGCYAAHSGVKRWNREAENNLLRAEKWAAISDWLVGQPYPDDFALAWKDVLFNQFHDILAGTSLEAAYEDARNLYGEALTIADRNLTYAVQALSWRVRIETEPGMQPIVVFNPHAWRSRVPVELELGSLSERAVLFDDDGCPVPMQPITSQATARGRYRIVFVADLPPMGYRTYRLLPDGVSPEVAPVEATDEAMENEWIQLRFDRETGYLSQLVLKESGADLLLGPAARPTVMRDTSDTWGHNVLRFNEEIGTFTARSVRLLEQGPVRATIRVVSEYNRSTLIQDFTLYRELERIDVHTMVDWHEQHALLKLQFPLKLDFAAATYEIPYGHVVRPVNGEEEPGQSWLDVSGIARGTGERYGLSLLNDGKYSFDVQNKVVSLTVLRAPIYAHHMPLMPDPDEQYAYLDQGRQDFTYTLLPHAGGWEGAESVRRAAELNQRPVAVIESFHPDGTLPARDSFVEAEPANIIVSALKHAEEEDALVLRAYEAHRVATDATIRLPRWGRTIQVRFDPCEIKSFLIPRDPGQPVIETNLLEWQE